MLHVETGLVPPIAPAASSPLEVGDVGKGPPDLKRSHVLHVDTMGPATATRPAPLRRGTARVQPDAEQLRRYAWEIGERRAHSAYVCSNTYVNLLVVAPGDAFIDWRLQQSWIDETARRKGNAWNGSRLVARLYDVSFIEFNGLNAHHMRDVPLDRLHGEQLLSLPIAGTAQIAEVGFLLRSGEFIAAARSPVNFFPSPVVSPHSDTSALYVDDRLTPEPVASPWEGAAYVRERSKPKLRPNLRIAVLSFEAAATGHTGAVATFVSSMSAELHAQGHDVHVFVPQRDGFSNDKDVAGVQYHALSLEAAEGPIAVALAFARALESRMGAMDPFDFFHMQDWMTALVPWLGTRPAVLAMSSLECTRRNGSPTVTDRSRDIEKLEREVAHAVDCIMVPEWMRDRAINVLGVDRARVQAFAMEGRPVDEWEAPLDTGRVKSEIGLHPFDRMLLFVGPLEAGAGPDLLVEALPTVLSRTPNARIAYVGCGGMHGQIEGRARQLGVAHAVRLLGHVGLPHLVPILRASEAVLLPSRHRVHQDDGVVELARRAGRAVLTTQGGPKHLVRHEETGLVVYDNPPSLVWGLSRLLGDARNTESMGERAIQRGEGASWAGMARLYADLCAQTFFELTEDSHGVDLRSHRSGGQA